MPTSNPVNLESLTNDAVASLGFEMLGMELNLSDGGGMMRIYIDHPERPIVVEDCATVSREVSASLDLHDPIPGKYRLEVSSPGMDRPLFKPSHYQRFIGEKVKLTTALPVNGRKRFSGTIAAATDTQVTVALENESIELPYAAVEKARLNPSFDKPGKPGSSKR